MRRSLLKYSVSEVYPRIEKPLAYARGSVQSHDREGVAGAGYATRPRILRIITRLNIGGPAIHTVLLTREMAAMGYDTKLVTGSCENDDGDMQYLLQAGDPVIRVREMSRSVSPWKNLRALWRLWRIMRVERPDIVHTHTAMAGCLGRTAAVLAGIPIIVHTFHGNSLRHYFSPIVSAVFLRIERLLARVTDAICVLSEQQAGELSGEFRIGDRSRFHVLPLGLDLSPFLSLPAPAANGILRVGWFGRLVPVKDVSLLVAAVGETVRTLQRIEFHVAGDGPDRPMIENACRRYGAKLVWHGWLSDITPVLAQCDILVQTSKNEGTPVALIQGMAAGRPFISTPAGGVVDMVCGAASAGPGGQWCANGVLVRPDPQNFAAAIRHLADNPEMLRAMSRDAREFASKYKKETLCANLDALYKKLLAEKTMHYAESSLGAADTSVCARVANPESSQNLEIVPKESV